MFEDEKWGMRSLVVYPIPLEPIFLVDRFHVLDTTLQAVVLSFLCYFLFSKFLPLIEHRIRQYVEVTRGMNAFFYSLQNYLLFYDL